MGDALRVAVPVLAAVLLHGSPAWAGQTCEARPLDVETVRRAMDLAERVAKRLDQGDARVVVLARAGQDLGRHGLRWSHMGYAYRDTASGRWRVVHKLNHCGTASSAVYRQGLGEFFLDRMHRYEAGYVPLSPQAQARLAPLLEDNSGLTRWHAGPYSMVAYPWATRYQQSNQWVLESLAGAMEPAVGSRTQAQAWLRLRDYRPTELRVGAMERLGARVSSAHIAFDDHPDAQRYAGRIETVTVDSAFEWLQRSGLGGPVSYVR